MVESGETGKVVKVLESTSSGNCLFLKEVLGQELRGPDMEPTSRFLQSGYLMAPQESPRVIKNESIVFFFGCVHKSHVTFVFKGEGLTPNRWVMVRL